MSLPDVTAVQKPQQATLGLDQQPLFELGLREVRAYARELWTDHNIHDPGITMLELLCYALTDLCYRACFPIEDLLAVADDNKGNMAGQFFKARQALPNGPLTELDYRKLLIDVEGVRNAWIHPVEPAPYYADSIEGRLLLEDPGVPGIREVRLRGLYGALIEYQGEDPAPADKARILAAARAALQTHRNLCEDFIEIKAVEPQNFLLCAELEIEPQADAAETYAKILLAVQEHLAPGVPRRTRAEMLQRTKPDGSRWTDPELFDGPALAHGFIDEAELAAAELRSSIRLSDVISLIMDIEGVRAVRDIVIRAASGEGDTGSEPPAGSKWEVSVEPGKRSTLDAKNSRLILYKGNMPLPRGADALTRYQALKDEAEAKFHSRPIDDPQIPLGRFRAAAVYESVQKHFPTVYGIGDAALPAGAGPDREAQARQLEGYLLFFDQLLANSCAQLGEVRQLFSRDPDVERTYFSQKVGGLEALYMPGADGVVLETTVAMLARRNRFLDHLIARFAERLPDDLEIQAALFGTTRAAVARAKCAFLGDTPRLGGERGLACDYTLDPASGAAGTNVSGLERRLAHLIGLGAIVREIYQEHDTDAIDEFRFRVRARHSGHIVLSSPLERRYASPEAALDNLGQALEAAQHPSGYRRRQDKSGKFYFNIVDGSGKVLAWQDQFFRTAAARDAAIDELMAIIAEHHGERLCVIENILLRPRAGAKDTFLPICAEPGCGEGCPGDDPYSYRLHVVLPAVAPRFRNMEFRRFAEEVIRQETPAHLLPKVCWVGDEEMTRIETAWAAWRALLAGTATANPAGKLAALAEALFEAKNVYPEPTLAACEAAEKFILGRSALGSTPPPG